MWSDGKRSFGSHEPRLASMAALNAPSKTSSGIAASFYLHVAFGPGVTLDLLVCMALAMQVYVGELSRLRGALAFAANEHADDDTLRIEDV